MSVRFSRNVSLVPSTDCSGHHDCSKNMAARGEAFFLCISMSKTLKIFWSENTGPISIYYSRNILFVTLYQVCSGHHDFIKNMAARGGRVGGGGGVGWGWGGGVWFPYTCKMYIENSKNFLVKHRTNFNISEILDHHVSLDHKIYTKILKH